MSRQEQVAGAGVRPARDAVERAYEFADLTGYSFKDRVLIRLADLVFFVLITLIGRTVRFEVQGWVNWDAASTEGNLPVMAFWHNRILLAT